MSADAEADPLRLVVLVAGAADRGLARRAAEVGHEVHLVDVSDGKTTSTAPRGDEESTGLLDGFDVAVINVPIAVRAGQLDLSAIERASWMLARALRPGATVVLSSATRPGTTEDVVVPLLEAGSGLLAGPDFFVGYATGDAAGDDTGDSQNPVLSVSGIDKGSLAAVEAFYRTLAPGTIALDSPREAELAALEASVSATDTEWASAALRNPRDPRPPRLARRPDPTG